MHDTASKPNLRSTVSGFGECIGALAAEASPASEALAMVRLPSRSACAGLADQYEQRTSLGRLEWGAHDSDRQQALQGRGQHISQRAGANSTC